MEIGAGLWLVAALIVGIVAAREFGRSGLAWFLLAIAFTPLVGVLLFVLPPRRVPCPFCAEPIKPSATVCRFCNRTLPPDQNRAGLTQTGRLVLLVLIAVAIGLAVSRCNYDIRWWKRSDPPMQVRVIVPSHR
jgi:hypothetical protein